MTDGTDLQQQVNDIFEAFRRTLQDLLTAEARQQVDSTVARLDQTTRFRVEDITGDVMISHLKLAAAADVTADARRDATASRRKRSSNKPRPGSRL